MTRYLISFLLVSACGNPSYPPELPLDEELTTCTADEDCVVVQLGCCDACNGGVAVSARADRAEDVRGEFAEAGCATVDCTLMDCPPLLATCPATTCTLEQGTFD